MTDKIYALDMNRDEWISFFTETINEPKFRADQVIQWMWQKKVFDVDEMTNLSLALREKLPEYADFSLPALIREQRSKDGTRKFLWQLRDGNSIETVMLKSGDRLTACISSQVGCPLGCTFCATGLSGFVRNMTAGEIAGQFLAMEKHIGRELNNIVFMGMGEPLLNRENVFKAVRMLNDAKMRNLGIRHITVSTSGIIPGIEEMADSGLGCRLAVSLHSVDDELRGRLMPINETYPTSQLREALASYQEKTGDRISIEYTLFGGINDSVEHARALVRWLKGIHAFINLIPYNSVGGRYERPDARNVLRFRTVLETAGFENEIREEQGSDIDAACGQLRRRMSDGAAMELEPAAHSVTKRDMRYSAADEKRETKEKRYGDERPTYPNRRKKPDFDKNDKKERYDNKDKKPERLGTKASGGFTEKRVSRKKTLPEKETYRSGKRKEERPTYRGQGEDFESERRGAEVRGAGKTLYERRESGGSFAKNGFDNSDKKDNKRFSPKSSKTEGAAKSGAAKAKNAKKDGKKGNFFSEFVKSKKPRGAKKTSGTKRGGK